jgi:hypothetical protein
MAIVKSERAATQEEDISSKWSMFQEKGNSTLLKSLFHHRWKIPSLSLNEAAGRGISNRLMLQEKFETLSQIK